MSTRPHPKRTVRAKAARKPRDINIEGRLWACQAADGAALGDFHHPSPAQLRRLAKWCEAAAAWLEARKP